MDNKYGAKLTDDKYQVKWYDRRRILHDTVFLKYQSSYISFKTIFYSRWGRCEHLKQYSMTEANLYHALVINANQLTPFYIMRRLF
jgi:hypothetical protein